MYYVTGAAVDRIDKSSVTHKPLYLQISRDRAAEKLSLREILRSIYVKRWGICRFVIDCSKRDTLVRPRLVLISPRAENIGVVSDFSFYDTFQ